MVRAFPGRGREHRLLDLPSPQRAGDRGHVGPHGLCGFPRRPGGAQPGCLGPGGRIQASEELGRGGNWGGRGSRSLQRSRVRTDSWFAPAAVPASCTARAPEPGTRTAGDSSQRCSGGDSRAIWGGVASSPCPPVGRDPLLTSRGAGAWEEPSLAPRRSWRGPHPGPLGLRCLQGQVCGRFSNSTLTKTPPLPGVSHPGAGHSRRPGIQLPRPDTQMSAFPTYPRGSKERQAWGRHCGTTSPVGTSLSPGCPLLVQLPAGAPGKAGEHGRAPGPLPPRGAWKEPLLLAQLRQPWSLWLFGGVNQRMKTSLCLPPSHSAFHTNKINLQSKCSKHEQPKHPTAPPSERGPQDSLPAAHPG